MKTADTKLDMTNIGLYTPFDSATAIDKNLAVELVSSYPHWLVNCAGCGMIKRADNWCTCKFGEEAKAKFEDYNAGHKT